MTTPLGRFRGSSLNLNQGKCDNLLVSWWIPTLCAFVYLVIDREFFLLVDRVSFMLDYGILVVHS